MGGTKGVRWEKSKGRLLIQAPGQSGSLDAIRKLVSDMARQSGFVEDAVAQVELAVDEACANVVQHAYAQDKPWLLPACEPEIRLEIRVEDGRLVIEISDHGQRFDFIGYRPETIDTRVGRAETGGYGIAILRKLMDEVDYFSNGKTRNTLRLAKRLPRP